MLKNYSLIAVSNQGKSIIGHEDSGGGTWNELVRSAVPGARNVRKRDLAGDGGCWLDPRASTYRYVGVEQQLGANQKKCGHKLNTSCV